MRKITSKLTFTGGYIINLAKPVNTALPIVSGLNEVGATLTAGAGTWLNNPTSFTYQWYSSAAGGILLPGQTANTYVPVSADVGHYVTIHVTAVNPAGSTAANSWNMEHVYTASPGQPVCSYPPVISSTTPEQGVALSTTNGTWAAAPASYAYQWNRAGTAISGATASSYIPVSADVGNALSVTVSASNGAGAGLPAASAPTWSAVVAEGGEVPANITLPAISGTVQVGQTLTASGGTWTNSPASYAYQWQNEGSAIASATSATYIIQASDIGALITLQVIATNSAGASIPAVSPLGTPVISTTVFYVSQSTGNDANAGTLAAPWQTVAKVNAQNFAPGTSVLFKRGDVWRVNDTDGHQLSPLPNVLSGSAGNPIVFDAYGTGPNPVLQGSVAASNTTDWTNIGTNLWQSVKTFPPIVQPGNPSGLNGLPNNNANDVGNIIWNSGGKTFVGVETGSNFTGSPGLAASPTAQGQWQFIIAAGAEQWTVQVYSVGNPATAMPGLELAIDKSLIYPFQINYVTFQNFTLQYCAGSAFLSLSCNHLIVRDCIIQWVGGGNIGGSGTRFGDAIDLEGTFTDNLAERLFVNEIFDAGITAQPGNVNGMANNITFRNNIVWNVISPLFIQYTPGSGTNTLSGLNVYNNTTYAPTAWSFGQRPNGAFAIGWYFFTDSTVSVTSAVFENNITAGNPLFIELMAQYNSNTGNYTQNYNCWKNDPANLEPVAEFFAYTPLTGKTMAIWAPTYPAEQQGFIDIDPAFTSQATGNFTPTIGSPVRGAGINLYSAGVVWDFNKSPRPMIGPFTMGAIQ